MLFLYYVLDFKACGRQGLEALYIAAHTVDGHGVEERNIFALFSKQRINLICKYFLSLFAVKLGSFLVHNSIQLIVNKLGDKSGRSVEGVELKVRLKSRRAPAAVDHGAGCCLIIHIVPCSGLNRIELYVQTDSLEICSNELAVLLGLYIEANGGRIGHFGKSLAVGVACFGKKLLSLFGIICWEVVNGRIAPDCGGYVAVCNLAVALEDIIYDSLTVDSVGDSFLTSSSFIGSTSNLKKRCLSSVVS